MKYFFVLYLFLLSNITKGQEIDMREENDEGVVLLTTTLPLQMEPNLFVSNALVIIPKDTLVPPDYVFSFFYNTPEGITLDTTCEVELRFMDGALYSFPYFKHREKYTEKDSLVCFQTFLSYECVQKMKNMSIIDYNFITPLYQHKITIEDKAKMIMPSLTRFILSKQEEEYRIIIQKK